MKKSIINARIITMDEKMTEYKKGFLTIEDDKIIKLGDMGSFQEEGETIEGKNGILMPGMINTHTHLGMLPFRSLGDDVKDRLRRFLFPLENKYMNEKLVYRGARYALCEMLLAGVTTVLDMYYFEKETAKAADDMHIRAILGETVADLKTCDCREPGKGFFYAEEFIKEWKNHKLITPCIAPHATNTNGEESLKRAKKISETYQVPITMHVAEMDYEMQYFKEAYSMSPIEFLNFIGCLDTSLIAAHCIYLSENDIALLKKQKVGVAHCIGSNTKSAKGVADVKAMLDAGIRVGLGTDGPTSGNTLDLLTQFKLFANFQKLKNQDRSIFPAHEIVALGTIQGAKVLHLDKQTGSLEVGKQADLVLVETDSVNMFPAFNPYSALVYSANAGNVDTVFVAGRCLVRHKELVGADLKSIRNDLVEAMEEMSESDIVNGSVFVGA